MLPPCLACVWYSNDSHDFMSSGHLCLSFCLSPTWNAHHPSLHAQVTLRRKNTPRRYSKKGHSCRENSNGLFAVGQTTKQDNERQKRTRKQSHSHQHEVTQQTRCRQKENASLPLHSLLCTLLLYLPLSSSLSAQLTNRFSSSFWLMITFFSSQLAENESIWAALCGIETGLWQGG
mmetsp:Transcript_30240/g.59383  ORF Transcript_30240/g.59383 Transcript_30240/m.59383 type:complete len:176 (-) Transcript_30240:108-635(-)